MRRLPGAETVLLADDHPVVRRGLAALLSGEDWIGRLIEAGTIAEALRLTVLERPGTAVVDLGLPDGDGVSLIRGIRRAVPECAVVVLTMTQDDATVHASLEAGASGYLLKESAPDALLPALRTVRDGGMVLGPQVATSALAGLRRTVPSPFDLLSPRELQHVGLLASGRSGAQIADALGVTEKTVRNQMAGILAKLGIADRVQIALMARDAGLHL
ncbi:MAG: response regulator transcription factor [Micropruina sp.]|uniref:response regulator n=1 Tax=Micropruina sp. TaxID=2737536 RepID=UPI0039E5F816